MTSPVPTDLACPNCQAAVGPADRFCESCGTSLLDPPLPAPSRTSPIPGASVLGPPRSGTAAARAAAVSGPCPDCAGTQVDAGYCAACGALLPDGTDHFEADLGPVVLVSDKGLVHTRNEDGVAAGVLADPVSVAAVVCDGISSVSRPQEASLAASEAALDELLAGLAAGRVEPAHHVAAAAKATQAVAALDTLGEADPPACTYVAATVTAAELVVSWIGDSRAYWLSREPDRSARLTDDDSWAGEMVRAGLLDEATAMTRPQAHAITRWVGSDTATGDRAFEPHVVSRTVDSPGLLLVCSDGLWNYLPEPDQLADVVFPGGETGGGPVSGGSVPGGDIMSAARRLNQLSLNAGGDDNITIVLIEVPPGERTTS